MGSAGATALNAAVESSVVSLSWHYLPVILSSSLIMLGWALIINNLGRRRYPVYWWAPGPTFVRDPIEESNAEVVAMEEGEVKREDLEEGALRQERTSESDDETVNGESSEAGAPESNRQSPTIRRPASFQSALGRYPGEYLDYRTSREHR